MVTDRRSPGSSLRRITRRIRERVEPAVRSAGRRLGALLGSDVLTLALIALAVVGNAIILPVPAVAVLALVIVVALLVVARNPLTLIVLYGISIFVIPTRFGLKGQSLVMVLGLVALGLWAFFRLQDGPAPSRRSNALPLVLAAFLAMRLVQYANAALHHRTPDRITAADRQIILVLSFIGIALFVSELARSRSRRRAVVMVVVMGTAFMAAVAVAEFAIGIEIDDLLRPPGFVSGARDDGGGALFAPDRFGIDRVFGTANGVIEFAAVLSAALPLATYVALRGAATWERNVGRLTVLLIIVGLPLAVTRTGVVGFVLAGVLTLAGLPKGQRARALGAFAAGFAVLLLFFPAVTDATIGLVKDFTGTQAENVGLEGRTGDYEIVWDLVQDQALLGEGLQTHDPILPRQVEGGRIRNLFLDNQYLSELLAGGVLGVLSLLSLPVSGVLAAGRVRRVATDDDDVALAGALRATVIVLAVTWSFYDSFSTRSATGLFFLVFGLLSALVASAAGVDVDGPAPVQPPRRDAAQARSAPEPVAAAAATGTTA